jgi:hypothetical protein
LFAQAKWDTAGTKALHAYCVWFLSRNYRNLDEKSKELVAACYQEEVVTKYPNSADYHGMPDSTRSRINTAIILHCAGSKLHLKLSPPENNAKGSYKKGCPPVCD